MDQEVIKSLQIFAEYFVREFETKLQINYMILEEGLKKTGKLARAFSNLAVTGGGALGTLAGGSNITGCIGMKLGEAAGGAVNYFDEACHTKKAVSLADLVYSFHENPAFYREYFVSVSVDIFQSFEMQFMKVTSDKSHQSALRKLAEDAVGRALNYLTKNEVDTAKAVLLGHSKLYSPLGTGPLPRKVKTPGYCIKYRQDWTEKEWWTSSLYEKVGIVKGDETLTYYKKRGKDSRTEKYGYRRLLWVELWDDEKKLYEESDTSKSLEFAQYEYSIKSQDLEQLAQKILSDINDKDPSLSEDRIKACIEETRKDLLIAVNSLKKQTEQIAEALRAVAEALKSLNTNECYGTFETHLKETNEGIHQNRQVMERDSNIAGSEHCDKELDNIRNHEKSPWILLSSFKNKSKSSHMEIKDLHNAVKGLAIMLLGKREIP